MRITIVIDDADPAAATDAALTISRAFVHTDGSSVPGAGVDPVRPAASSRPVVDVDVGPAPHVDGSPPSPSGSTSDPGPAPDPAGDERQPATPNPAAHPDAESAGAAPDLGGG